MNNTHWIAALSFSIIVATAQTTPSQTDYRGQSWVGLLVSASCEEGKKGSSARSASDREANLTVNSTTTTPAVDAAGTRGSSNAADQDAKSASGPQTVPATGDVMGKGASSADPAWEPARKQARSLGASCTVDAKATKFALLLPGGSMLYFDELANQEIAKKLPSSAGGTKARKVLRVSVQGKMQNGKIALDGIQL